MLNHQAEINNIIKSNEELEQHNTKLLYENENLKSLSEHEVDDEALKIFDKHREDIQRQLGTSVRPEAYSAQPTGGVCYTFNGRAGGKKFFADIYMHADILNPRSELLSCKLQGTNKPVGSRNNLDSI